VLDNLSTVREAYEWWHNHASESEMKMYNNEFWRLPDRVKTEIRIQAYKERIHVSKRSLAR
jgi:hypothetical protein